MSRSAAAAACAGAAAAALAFLGNGCGPAARRAEPSTGRPRPVGGAEAGAPVRDQLLSGAVAIFANLDRYDPVRGTEQVFDRLVQWQHAANRDPGRDPAATGLVDSVPEPLRAAAGDILDRASFDAVGDVDAIRDRCWLNTIARRVGGREAGSDDRTAADELAVAERLFCWTVNFLAPVSDPPMVPTAGAPGGRWFFPGEILLAGRASGPQRAWIFLELLHQAGLDGVMLATPSGPGLPPRPWLPAVVIDGEAYLFEPTYGMAVPGPGGRGVATARQAASDPSILAALSLPERPYPVQAADLARGLVPLALADPWSLAPRMAAVDRELAAAHGIRAAADPAVIERAMAALPGDPTTGGAWTFPWETVARRSQAGRSLGAEISPLQTPVPDPSGRPEPFRPLFAGRVREFRGEVEGPAGAKAAYLAARPSRRATAAAVAPLPEQQAAEISRRLTSMKEDATYWLGLLLLAAGDDAAAVDYLDRMTLEASPDSRWADAARINLALAVARLGDRTRSVGLLREDESPQRFGSRLLAGRLEAGGVESLPSCGSR